MTKPPVSFSDKAAAAKTAGGYPVQISARDLDANFVFATLEVSDTSPQGDAQPFTIDEFTGAGGLKQRRLIFKPAAPSSDGVFAVLGGSLTWMQVPPTGTHVLGAVNGSLQWIATEEC
jgi:hypothetical protein